MRKKSEKQPVKTLGMTLRAFELRADADVGVIESQGKQPPNWVSLGKKPIGPDSGSTEGFSDPKVQTQPQANTPEQQPVPDMGDASNVDRVPVKPVTTSQPDKDLPNAQKLPATQSLMAKQTRALLRAKRAQSIPTKPPVNQPNKNSPEAARIPSSVHNMGGAHLDASSIPTKPAVTQPNKQLPNTQVIPGGASGILNAPQSGMPAKTPTTTQPDKDQPESLKIPKSVENMAHGIDKGHQPDPSVKKTYEYPNPKTMLKAKMEDKMTDRMHQIAERVLDSDKRRGLVHKAIFENRDPADYVERQAHAWDAGYRSASTGLSLDRAKLAHQRDHMGYMNEFQEGFEARTAEQHEAAPREQLENQNQEGNLQNLGGLVDKQATGMGNDSPGTRAPDNAGERPLESDAIEGTGMPDLRSIKSGQQMEMGMEGAEAEIPMHEGKVADIEDDPGKWEKYWKSLVGEASHKWTKCHDKLKDHMTDEQAAGLCNKLKNKYGSYHEASLSDAYRQVGRYDGWSFEKSAFSKLRGALVARVEPDFQKFAMRWEVMSPKGQVATGSIPVKHGPRQAMMRAQAFCDVILDRETSHLKVADLTKVLDSEFTRVSADDHAFAWKMDEDGDSFKYFSDQLTGVVKDKGDKFKWKLWMNDDKVEKGKAKSLAEAQEECEAAAEKLLGPSEGEAAAG